MACSSKSRAVLFFMVFIVGLLFAAGVKAQASDFPQAPAPSPTMDTGAGFLITYSGVFVCSSLLLSILALLCHSYITMLVVIILSKQQTYGYCQAVCDLLSKRPNKSNSSFRDDVAVYRKVTGNFESSRVTDAFVLKSG
ncbi:hypothetical protein RJT34_30111 [Clitoria ternatea]|uniref:Uncharacterized protein n=1 Tax=Clitoria ternatea TaxID=43366 RepID=A0AAN9I1P6_CLITE